MLVNVHKVLYTIHVSYKTLQNITKHGGTRNDKRTNYPKRKESIRHGRI